MPISVSIIEDHRDTRETLIKVIQQEPELRFVNAHATAESGLKNIPVEKPNVALIDINLPGMSGIECVAKLKVKLPTLRILILTMYDESELIFNALRAGASGYLLKTTSPEEL